VAKVVLRQGAVGLPFVGTTSPSRRSIVGSGVAGRVDKIEKEEGDYVEEKQPLVQLRTKTINLQLAAAQAEEKLRREEVNELKAGTRQEEKDAAKARFDAAKVLFKYAQSKYDRTEELFKRKAAATEDEYEEALLAKLSAEFGKIAAEANFDLAIAGTRAEKLAQGNARLLVQQQEIARLHDVISKYSIKAPFSGYIVQKHAEVGDWLNVGAAVIEVVELDPVRIDITLPELFIDKLKVGAEATIQFDALTDVFVGKVHRIIPQAVGRSRAFPVRVLLENPRGKDGSPRIKAGMLAHVQLPVGKPRGGLFVPSDALVLQGTRKSVFVVQESAKGMTVIPVPVRVGIAVGDLREVSDDRGMMRPGVQVVVEGNERLRPGQPIKILK